MVYKVYLHMAIPFKTTHTHILMRIICCPCCISCIRVCDQRMCARVHNTMFKLLNRLIIIYARTIFTGVLETYVPTYIYTSILNCSGGMWIHRHTFIGAPSITYRIRCLIINERISAWQSELQTNRIIELWYSQRTLRTNSYNMNVDTQTNNYTRIV